MKYKLARKPDDIGLGFFAPGRAQQHWLDDPGSLESPDQPLMLIFARSLRTP